MTEKPKNINYNRSYSKQCVGGVVFTTRTSPPTTNPMKNRVNLAEGS